MNIYVNKFRQKYNKYFLNKIRILSIKIQSFRQTKKIFVFDIPEHGNIGDHAIASAQKKFIESNFPDYSYIEVPADISLVISNKLTDYISKHDIVMFHGGGNFGTLYPSHNDIRKAIISNLACISFIQLPQSVYFHDDNKVPLDEITESFAQKNNQIYLFAREKLSFDFFKDYFPDVNNYLIPDIVFSLPKVNSEHKNGILLILRNDIEKNINFDKNALKKKLVSEFNDVSFSDTHIGEGLYIDYKKRDKYVSSKLEEFSRSKIIVTDRLHGMIFAYISNTPCIAIDNNNHKVRETYNAWLKDCNYIEYVDSPSEDELVDLINQVINTKPLDYSLNEYYEPLIKVIRNN